MEHLLNETELKTFIEWQKTLPPEPQTAIGGRFTFCFTPTSIGTTIIIKDCISDREIDVTDYSMW